MITIDGHNIKDMWTLTPVMDSVYNQLMKAPEIKERVTNDWSDEDGVEVLIEAARLKPIDMTLTFMCDTYAKYKEFCKYLRDNQTISLYCDYTGLTYVLEFQKHSGFNEYRDYNIFAVVFRQNNPTI